MILWQGRWGRHLHSPLTSLNSTAHYRHKTDVKKEDENLKRIILSLLALICLMLAVGAAAESVYPESDHPYASDSDVTWTYTYPGAAEYLKITFTDDSRLENTCDTLTVTDSADHATTLTGDIGGREVYIAGKTATFRLLSDGSAEYYGFAIESIVPATAEEYNQPRFSVSRGVLTGYSGMADHFVVPESVDGQTITELDAGVFYSATFSTIELPDTLRSIGYAAFENCKNLTTIDIPDGVTEIDSYAFSGCERLESAELPKALSDFGYGVFEDCAALKAIEFPTGITALPTYSFMNCASLREVRFLADEIKLAGWTFVYCEALETVVGNVSALEDATFYGCKSLKSISLSDSMNAFPDRMYGISGKTVFTLGKNCPVLDIIRECGFTYLIRETGETNAFVSTATTVDEKVREIVNAVIRPGMSDYQKALALHNWLIFNANYDYSYSHYSASGVLLDGLGVCQSYSEAYRLLLNAVGIQNDMESGANHVWNMILLDGEWYHVDVTWDDPNDGGSERWEFFGLSNYALDDVRSHECFNENHVATAYKYNYAYRHGMLDERLDELRATIQQRLDAGETRFSFIPESFTGSVYGISDRTAILIVRDDVFTVNGSAAALTIEMDNDTLEVSVEADISAFVPHTPDFVLPAAIQSIEDGAFERISASYVLIPYGAVSIGSGAFANCAKLREITIPASVTDIADDAFVGVQDFVIIGHSGSAAEACAKACGARFEAMR